MKTNEGGSKKDVPFKLEKIWSRSEQMTSKPSARKSEQKKEAGYETHRVVLPKEGGKTPGEPGGRGSRKKKERGKKVIISEITSVTTSDLTEREQKRR